MSLKLNPSALGVLIAALIETHPRKDLLIKALKIYLKNSKIKDDTEVLEFYIQFVEDLVTIDKKALQEFNKKVGNTL